MSTAHRCRSPWLVAASVALAVVWNAVADACCNIVPPAEPTFRGTLANVDRPFAHAGDWVRIPLDALCHGTSPGFAGTASDQVVTVVFRPPASGPRNVVALSSNCAAVDTATCGALPDVDRAVCIQVNDPGAPVALERRGPRDLRFRFPDTDALVAGALDGLGLAGPAAIGVTQLRQPLPCQLASSPCTGVTGLRACVDGLFADNNSCDATPGGFTSFTALPAPNDYASVCTTPSPPCEGTVDEVRFTVDADGNVLIPM